MHQIHIFVKHFLLCEIFYLTKKNAKSILFFVLLGPHLAKQEQESYPSSPYHTLASKTPAKPEALNTSIDNA